MLKKFIDMKQSMNSPDKLGGNLDVSDRRMSIDKVIFFIFPLYIRKIDGPYKE